MSECIAHNGVFLAGGGDEAQSIRSDNGEPCSIVESFSSNWKILDAVEYYL